MHSFGADRADVSADCKAVVTKVDEALFDDFVIAVEIFDEGLVSESLGTDVDEVSDSVELFIELLSSATLLLSIVNSFLPFYYFVFLRPRSILNYFALLSKQTKSPKVPKNFEKTDKNGLLYRFFLVFGVDNQSKND